MNYDDYDQTFFEKLLVKALSDRKKEILEMLGSSDGIKDFPTYTKWTGYIKCLTEVRAMMASVNETIRKAK